MGGFTPPTIGQANGPPVEYFNQDETQILLKFEGLGICQSAQFRGTLGDCRETPPLSHWGNYPRGTLRLPFGKRGAGADSPRRGLCQAQHRSVAPSSVQQWQHQGEKFGLR